MISKFKDLVKSFISDSKLGMKDPDFEITFVSGVPGSGTSLLHELLYQRYHNIVKIVTKDSPFIVKKVDSYNSIDDYIKDAQLQKNTTANNIRIKNLKVYKKNIYNNSKHLMSNYKIHIFDKAPVLHLIRANKLKLALPKSKFLIIFRNPINVIEGMKRKWKLFNKTDLFNLCSFWKALYEDFIKDTRKFPNDVIWMQYEELAKHPDKELDKIAKLLNLNKRKQLVNVEKRPNSPGKGLRNSENGIIKVFLEEIPKSFTLNQTEIEYIDSRLTPFYEELIRIYSTRS